MSQGSARESFWSIPRRRLPAYLIAYSGFLFTSTVFFVVEAAGSPEVASVATFLSHVGSRIGSVGAGLVALMVGVEGGIMGTIGTLIERAKKQARQEGRQEGRQEQDRQWRAWNDGGRQGPPPAPPPDNDDSLK